MTRSIDSVYGILKGEFMSTIKIIVSVDAAQVGLHSDRLGSGGGGGAASLATISAASSSSNDPPLLA